MFQKLIITVCLFVSFLGFAIGQESLSKELTSKENPTDFADYLSELKRVALAANISPLTVDLHFQKIKPFKRTFMGEKISTKTDLEHYIPSKVPAILISTARVFFKENEQAFNRIGDKYGVQPRFLIALWGLETGFGESQGHFPALSVLASSAFEASQKGQLNNYGEFYYVDEFIAALKIMERHAIPFDKLTSTFEGEMGHLGIRPSQYLAYGQDGSGDGRIDIWNDINDAMATSAYMMQQIGWKSDETWGRQVKLNQPVGDYLVGLAVQKPFSQWQSLGVRRFEGGDLPDRDDMYTSLLAPDGVNGRKYLIYSNYRVLKRFIRRDKNILAATYLSERIR
jgi:membrane-bound lytic murein transglycosylase B